MNYNNDKVKNENKGSGQGSTGGGNKDTNDNRGGQKNDQGDQK